MPAYAAMSAEDLFDLYRHKKDEYALRFLLTEHEFIGKLNGLLYKLGVSHEHDREDMLQELHIHLHRHGHQFDRKRAQLITWLGWKARKMRVDYFAGRGARQAEPGEDAPPPADGPDLLCADDATFDQSALPPTQEKQEMLKSVCNAIYAALRDMDSEVCALFFDRLCAGKEYTEISDSTGRKPATLRSDFMRAVTDVRAALLRHGFDPAALDLLADDPEAFCVRHGDLERLADESLRAVCREYLFEGASAKTMARKFNLTPREVRSRLARGLSELMQLIRRAGAVATPDTDPDASSFATFADRLLILGLSPATRATGSAHSLTATLKLLFRTLSCGSDSLKLALGACLRDRQATLGISLDTLAARLQLAPPQLALLLTDALPARAFTPELRNSLRAVFAFSGEELDALIGVTAQLTPAAAVTRGTALNYHALWQRVADRLKA